MKLSAKQIAFTGVLLAVAIGSQFFKNMSVYFTGSIVNLVLLLTAGYCGPICAVIISIITPVTAFFITGSPLMSMVPAIIPAIMIGNVTYVLVFYFVTKALGKTGLKLFHLGSKGFRIGTGVTTLIGGIGGAVLKALFMGVTIVKILIPYFALQEVPEKMVNVAKTQFSITQLFTALIGAGLAAVIFVRLKTAGIDSIETNR